MGDNHPSCYQAGQAELKSGELECFVKPVIAKYVLLIFSSSLMGLKFSPDVVKFVPTRRKVSVHCSPGRKYRKHLGELVFPYLPL